MVFDQFYGKDVPHVFWKDVCDEEINVVGRVTEGGAVGCLYTIMRSGGGFPPHRFYLNAPELFSGADDHIVAIAVAPRLGDGKAESCGFAHKGKFSDLAPLFSIEFGCMQQFIV